jgi:hypothetical protein
MRLQAPREVIGVNRHAPCDAANVSFVFVFSAITHGALDRLTGKLISGGRSAQPRRWILSAV